MLATIKIATKEDIPIISDFLVSMKEELDKTTLDRNSIITRLDKKFDEATWFLFYDENGIPFGTRYAAKVFAWYDDSFRYILGGAYISPAFRGRGYYRQVMDLMQEWAKAQGAYGFRAEVHIENEHSAKALQSVGFEELDYKSYTKEF